MAKPLSLGSFTWVLGAFCNLNRISFDAKFPYQHISLFDVLSEPYSLIPSRTNQQQAGQLRFEGISFRYSEHHPWLYKNLSLTIKPNKCTVIMGPSGCGKSTLTKLLLGFVQPQEGSIQLDGRDIRHLSANELRHAFGVVPQETTLFAGTLYDNFTLAKPHAIFEHNYPPDP